MATPRLELGFSDVLDLLTLVFEVPPDGRAALTSRLKHLQAKRFPAGVNVKKARVRYDGTAVTGIVTVMALVASFVPPDVAVAIVRENWDELKELVADAARAARSLGGTPAAEETSTHALIVANSLSELGRADAAEGRGATVRGARTLLTLRRSELAALTSSTLGGANTLLDVAALIERTAAKLVAPVGRDPATGQPTGLGQDSATLLADLVALGDVAAEVPGAAVYRPGQEVATAPRERRRPDGKGNG